MGGKVLELESDRPIKQRLDCGLFFGVRFLFLWHKNRAAASADYSSTFANSPVITGSIRWIYRFKNPTYISPLFNIKSSHHVLRFRPIWGILS